MSIPAKQVKELRDRTGAGMMDCKIALEEAQGNFDEAIFDDPMRFDVGRDPNPHVTFGPGGPHFCTGAHLARLEIRVLLEELIPRLDQVELVGPVERTAAAFVGGVKHLPIRWTLRP